jgi:hypothetical protein
MLKKNTQTILGVLLFAISLITYVLTLEPTTSFWDCSEFITCANKLEIAHAPGAPMFMLLGRFFSLFAPNPKHVAYMINLLSAVASALTVMFLFWIICWFAEKLLQKSKNKYPESHKKWLVYGSAAIGALSYAFSDSAWFSAVEGEVYATSSLFSAIVFWAITKWEQTDKNNRSDHWIVLIFYLLGLSVGIHLLNVLTVPAMALVFYYKNYQPTTKGVIATIISGFLLVVILIFGIIPGVASFAAYTDLLFVNSFKLPVYSGAISFVIILLFSLYYIYKKALGQKRKWVNTLVLCFAFWLIGYSSFTLLVIRSVSNPFVDMNNVENVFGLVNYLNREQYPKRPLFYGNNYNSPIVDVGNRYTYKLVDGKYHKDELNPNYVFDENTLTFFPRMASTDPDHTEAYKKWVDIKGKKVDVFTRDGTKQTITVPTFSDNLKFFFKYQLGHMYFRYFLWNFVGRQNDAQGRGGYLDGNWITGISFIDVVIIGSGESRYVLDNQQKSKNTYYALPLIWGLIGLFYQYRKDSKSFLVNFLLFVFTGIAIVVYLNEVPITPRERDYAYVGSYFAFSIWIGLGAIAVVEKLKIRNNKNLIFSVLVLFVIAIPLNMLFENYDDHDRSNRYTARDYAKNMLESCEQNAILFTTADNDTYPIWYIQEVEGFRTDVRQVLQPFVAIDWYGEQLNLDYGNRKGLGVSMKGTELLMKNNTYFPVINKIDSAIDLEQTIEFVMSKKPKTKLKGNDNSFISFIPGENLSLKVNKANCRKSCSYWPSGNIKIPDNISIKLSGNYLYRGEFLILDIIAKNNWKRPIYFYHPSQVEKLGLADYLHREGILYRLLPYKNTLPDKLAKNQAVHQYNLFKNKFKWGNVNQPNVYLDNQNIQIINQFRFRESFAELAKTLAKANEKQKAIEILDLATNLFPSERVPYSIFVPEIVKGYYVANAKEKANLLAIDISKNLSKNIRFYKNLKKEKGSSAAVGEVRKDLYILQELVKITEAYSPETSKEIMRIFEEYYTIM